MSARLSSILSSTVIGVLISKLLKWSRGDSNPSPPPCKGESTTSRLFADVQKLLQITIFSLIGFRECSPLFVQVGVKLVSTGVDLAVLLHAYLSLWFSLEFAKKEEPTSDESPV